MSTNEEIRALVNQLPKEDFTALWDVIFALEHHFDCRLMKYGREDIQFHLGLLTEGEKTTFTDEEWEEFTSTWSWRHLEEWIITDNTEVWMDDLQPYIAKTEPSTTE